MLLQQLLVQVRHGVSQYAAESLRCAASRDHFTSPHLRKSEMDDSLLTGIWKSYVVLACITCEDVILLSRADRDRKTARKPLEDVVNLLPIKLINKEYDKIRQHMNGLFLPTVCSSCSKNSNWSTFSIKRGIIETWQPYLALCAFLEGDLSLLGSAISVVHYDDVKSAIGSAYIIRSVEINPSAEVAAELEPYLKGGFI